MAKILTLQLHLKFIGKKMQEYSNSFSIQCTEANTNRKYKVYSFLCATQEIAGIHAGILGFGYDDLTPQNCAWVLSRIKGKIISPAIWQEKVSLTTWHKGAEGVFGLRDFELKNTEEKTLAICTSSWLIINLETRRMQRAEKIIGLPYHSSALKKHAIEEMCSKLISPPEMEHCGSRKVKYSDIDMNIHANNAKFLEWALDCLNPEILFSKEIEEFQLNFNHEATLGEQIDFYFKAVSENEYFIDGRKDGNNVFQLSLKLK